MKVFILFLSIESREALILRVYHGTVRMSLVSDYNDLQCILRNLKVLPLIFTSSSPI